MDTPIHDQTHEKLMWKIRKLCDIYEHYEKINRYLIASELRRKYSKSPAFEYEEHNDHYLCFLTLPNPRGNLEVIIPKEYLEFSEVQLTTEFLFRIMAAIPYPSDIEKTQAYFSEFLSKIKFGSIWSYELRIMPQYKWSYVRTEFNNVASFPVSRDAITKDLTESAAKAAFGFVAFLLGKGEEINVEENNFLPYPYRIE